MRSAAAVLLLLAPRAHAAAADAALAARDAARPAEASAAWTEASGAPGADGFVWNQRGWSELAAGRSREARASFARAADRAATSAAQAESNVGLGLSFLLDGKPRDAREPLRRAAILGPYAIAVTARLSADAALAGGDREAARQALRQALEMDPSDREALRRLMTLLEKMGDHYSAWRAAERALRMDPLDPEARRVLERAGRGVTGDRDAVLGLRRMLRPALDPAATEPAISASSPTLRVGLYSAQGRPGTLTACVLVPNMAFKISGPGATPRASGGVGEPRRVEFSSGTVDVRDSARNLLFSSTAPFRLAPAAARGSVLVAVARGLASDADWGDREVRGGVEVVPGERGFALVEEVPLELYLYGAVSQALPEDSPPEAYKAEAVVARTAAAWAAAHRPDAPERWDVLDDDGLLRTFGVSGELRAAVEAVAATAGLVLARDGRLTPAPQHEDSGGWTEDDGAGLVSVPDAAKPGAPPRTPLEIERFVHEPPADLFSASGPARRSAGARWMRVLDAGELRQRAARRLDIGRLRALRVSARTQTGRAKALEVVGARGTLVYTGFEEIQALLSPGSLRSALFTLQPLYDGRDVKSLVVWGAGTGSGLGLSRAGAVGRAASGAGWREIVSAYFPGAEIATLDRLTAARSEKK